MIGIRHSVSNVSLSKSVSYSDAEIERMRLCGTLFDRRSNTNKKLLNEFFHKEPCLYNTIIYKYAARIFDCLKADLNENPILKMLKKDQQTANPSVAKVTEVPRIEYRDNQEKRITLKLAFSILKFQKILEDLLDDCHFYGKHPESKDEQSLVCTILFDYMMRKFQLRELTEEDLLNSDRLVSLIETWILQEKTHLAAALAKNRIKADALSVEELLPIELREVETHKAELPIYCWINPLKTQLDFVINHLTNVDGLKQVESKDLLEKKCFMLDSHCYNVLMFHYSFRNNLTSHEFVKAFKLIIQDKSSCLAPHTVKKLLSKKDDVIITNVSGGLVTGFIGAMMQELEGRVFAFGCGSDEKLKEMSAKMDQIGCSKYVKLLKEDFLDCKFDDAKYGNAKVILINAPCSKSALMNPLEFLFQEGEDVRLLRDFSLNIKAEDKVKKCVSIEEKLLKHAFRFQHVRAIAYQTYSKFSLENEDLVKKMLQEFNENRRSIVFPYKLSPPVIPLNIADMQTDDIIKGTKYLQFRPSSRMNGCFIALLARDRDAKLEKEAKKMEKLNEKKAREAALALAAQEDEQELTVAQTQTDRESLLDIRKKASLPANLTKDKKKLFKRKTSLQIIHKTAKEPSIDERLKELQNRTPSGFLKMPSLVKTAVSEINLESQLNSIGKLSKSQVSLQQQQRSSTPHEDTSRFYVKEFEFKMNNQKEDLCLSSITIAQNDDQLKVTRLPKKKIKMRKLKNPINVKNESNNKKINRTQVKKDKNLVLKPKKRSKSLEANYLKPRKEQAKIIYRPRSTPNRLELKKTIHKTLKIDAKLQVNIIKNVPRTIKTLTHSSKQTQYKLRLMNATNRQLLTNKIDKLPNKNESTARQMSIFDFKFDNAQSITKKNEKPLKNTSNNINLQAPRYNQIKQQENKHEKVSIERAIEARINKESLLKESLIKFHTNDQNSTRSMIIYENFKNSFRINDAITTKNQQTQKKPISVREILTSTSQRKHITFMVAY